MKEDLNLTCDDPAALKRVVVLQNEGEWSVNIPDGFQTSSPIKYHCAGAVVKIRIGKSARICFVEELTGGNSHNVEIFLESGAHVEFISQQTSDSSSPITIKQRAHVGDNATIKWMNVTLAAAEVDHDLLSELTGADAVSAIDWMFYAKDDEKYRLSAHNVFNGRRGGGEITMKGVAEGKGHVRCNGMLEVGAGGGQTNTYLVQDVLMLDTTAKVDAIPGLEIKTNDVKASHSATVSKVTDEDLFYFAARGIVDKEAKRMFVEGFLGEMAGKIEDTTVREEILASVQGKYG